MRKHIGWLWVIGIFGFVAVADARPSSSPAAGMQFDVTYAFVSSTKVNETYRDFHNRELQCRNRRAGPLTIVNGQARYTSRSGRREFEGTIGSRGELAMRSTAAAANRLDALPSTVIVSGSIDDQGTIRARQTCWFCRYDFIWQKQSK
jgi:hypothetical protein